MDIERFVASRIADATGYRAALEVPDVRPDEFVTVERTGGPSGRFDDEPRLVVQSWAMTRRRAAEMAGNVNSALKGLMVYDNVFSVSIDGTYRWPDPVSGQERYQTVVSLTTYE